MALTTPYSYWTLLVSYTSALSQLALTYHWQTRGGHYFSDHQLYQRIYDETYAELDGFAERAIGIFNNPNVVDPIAVVRQIDVTGKASLIPSEPVPGIMSSNRPRTQSHFETGVCGIARSDPEHRHRPLAI